MDVNAKVDIGQNLTSLLERLAQQIGTTADKVFPWYVQQAYIEGVTTLVAVAVLLIASIVTLSISLPLILLALNEGLITCGFCIAWAGYLHSCVTPTTIFPAPSL